MDENEFEFEGKNYIAVSYTGGDCGCEQSKCCAFDRMRHALCSRFKCTPDKRQDGRNVIFLEKQQ